MKKLRVAFPDRAYHILIERGLLDQAGNYCRGVMPKARRLAVVTDDIVGPLYGERICGALCAAGFSVHLMTLPAGEPTKSMSMLERLYDDFLSMGLTRTDAVVAFGGGVVGDLAGFAAATILRGVDFVQIPTTLLAQVDSSVGGKVAVNLKAGKNLAGCFWQPKLVLMDPSLLGTLEDKTFSDGMAEVIKYGCILDAALYTYLEQHPSRAELMVDMESILYTCCDLKRQVVVSDERDTGRRMLLNFGHTLGHAYELAGNYMKYTHGEAVAAGMVKALELGVALGITPPELSQRLKVLLSAFGLPIAIACGRADYEAAIGLDKKGAGDKITLILLDKLGRAIPHVMEKKDVLARLEGLE